MQLLNVPTKIITKILSPQRKKTEYKSLLFSTQELYIEYIFPLKTYTYVSLITRARKQEILICWFRSYTMFNFLYFEIINTFFFVSAYSQIISLIISIMPFFNAYFQLNHELSFTNPKIIIHQQYFVFHTLNIRALLITNPFTYNTHLILLISSFC